jgi:hypothetical protein
MNTINRYSAKALWFAAIMLTAFVAGCNSGNSSAPAVGSSDPAALSVISTNPADSATNVSINQKVIATFSESMDAATIDDTSFTVNGAGEAAMVGTVSLDVSTNTAIFVPGSNFTASTVYTATITTAVKSTSGKVLASNYVWTFTSGTTADTTVPTVISTRPDDGAINFAINKNISATFSESMDPTTVNASSFTLSDDGGATFVSGTVTYNDNDKVATFNPDGDLAKTQPYTATITTGAKDLAGNAVFAKVEWAFTTGTEVVQSRIPVDLGTAGNFVILAKTGISKTGAAGTAITGDIGVSPAALTYITGFSQTMDASNVFATSDYVTGSIYAADMAVPTPANMTTAISNMETAYTDAAGRSLPDFTELGAGNVSGMTLEPGLYKWGTNVLITNAGVTIAGNSDPDDVWIFQIAGDLIVDNAAIMTLTGGALPENIFWQVAGGAGVSLGTTAQFKGIALAQKAIVVNSGATVNGRLLAQTAVTLDGNAVTQP